MKSRHGFEILEDTIELLTFDAFAGAGCKEIQRFGDIGAVGYARCLVKGPAGTIAFAVVDVPRPRNVLCEIEWKLAHDPKALAALGCADPFAVEHYAGRFDEGQIRSDGAANTGTGMAMLAEQQRQMRTEAWQRMCAKLEFPLGNPEPSKRHKLGTEFPSGNPVYPPIGDEL